jgi:hypothetical protein
LEWGKREEEQTLINGQGKRVDDMVILIRGKRVVKNCNGHNHEGGVSNQVFIITKRRKAVYENFAVALLGILTS